MGNPVLEQPEAAAWQLLSVLRAEPLLSVPSGSQNQWESDPVGVRLRGTVGCPHHLHLL